MGLIGVWFIGDRPFSSSCACQWIGFVGKIWTGNYGFYHYMWRFPVNFPLNQSIDYAYVTYWCLRSKEWGFIIQSITMKNNMNNHPSNLHALRPPKIWTRPCDFHIFWQLFNFNELWRYTFKSVFIIPVMHCFHISHIYIYVYIYIYTYIYTYICTYMI